MDIPIYPFDVKIVCTMCLYPGVTTGIFRYEDAAWRRWGVRCTGCCRRCFNRVIMHRLYHENGIDIRLELIECEKKKVQISAGSFKIIFELIKEKRKIALKKKRDDVEKTKYAVMYPVDPDPWFVVSRTKTKCEDCGTLYPTGAKCPCKEYCICGHDFFSPTPHSETHDKMMDLRRCAEIRSIETNNHPSLYHNWLEWTDEYVASLPSVKKEQAEAVAEVIGDELPSELVSMISSMALNHVKVGK